jgi:hypothetical protein
MARRLIKLGLLLLAGAIINIAVAWVFAYRAPPLSLPVSISSAQAQAATPPHRAAPGAQFIGCCASSCSGRSDHS